MDEGVSTGHGVTAQPALFSLLCKGDSCRTIVGKAHIVGLGVVQIDCPKCGTRSEFKYTFEGVVGRVIESARHGNGSGR